MTYRLETDHGESITIEDGRIVPEDRTASLTLRLGSGLLRPGLINAHDHLHRNHYPRLGTPPYRSVYEWGEDIHRRCAAEIARAKLLPRREALLFGALKNLVGGVSTVVHHDPWESTFDEGFPLRTARLRVAHTLRLDRNLPNLDPSPDEQPSPFTIHLAEGTDPTLRAEVDELAQRGFLNQHLLAVHVVGIDESGARAIRSAGAAVVWCPTSNEFLYHAAAPASLFDGRIDVLLGTDSLLSGEGTLLHELRAARQIGRLDDTRLQAAVGDLAARRLGCPPPVLKPGAAADVVFLHRSLLEAQPRDVGLVVVAGRPRIGDPAFQPLFDYCRVATQSLEVDGVRKLVATPLGDVAHQAVSAAPECGRFLLPADHRVTHG